jgi:hypothetical protein
MHPTRDTAALKFPHWLGRAGDAWRWAAEVNKSELKFLP